MKEGSDHKPQGTASSPVKVNQPGAGVTRRDFLRWGTAATLGIISGSLWLPRSLRAGADDTSRVVIVTDANAAVGSIVQPDIIRIMVDAGIMALTDAATPDDAWLSLFPELAADLSIGIKVNTINNYLPSHPAVAFPIADSLATVPVGGSNYSPNQIVIWDRTDGELQAAGYELNTSASGVRCFGTNHPGIGFAPETLSVNGSNQHTSRCYTDYSDNVINLCVLKNHNFAGVSHSLKNHYGGIDDPGSMHGNYCRYFIPALNQALFATYGDKQKLNICDAVFGIYAGGPMGYPQFAYNGILLSQDPVALDAICRTILEDYNCTTLWMSDHIDIASQEPYNLGNSALEDIEVVHVENPSAVRSDPRRMQPAGITLEKNYPEPFNSATTIPIILDRTASVDLTIYNLRGRAVKTLYQGTLSAGTHRLIWSGEDRFGRPASSGNYIVRLKTHYKTHSRTITLLR